MYAVIQTGGKQHRVSEGERLKVEKLPADVGNEVSLDVLMVGGDDTQPKVGTPLVDGASVKAKVLSHGKGKKIRVFKKKRRKGYHRTLGHRQPCTELEITAIEV